MMAAQPPIFLRCGFLIILSLFTLLILQSIVVNSLKDWDFHQFRPSTDSLLDLNKTVIRSEFPQTNNAFSVLIDEFPVDSCLFFEFRAATKSAEYGNNNLDTGEVTENVIRKNEHFIPNDLLNTIQPMGPVCTLADLSTQAIYNITSEAIPFQDGLQYGYDLLLDLTDLLFNHFPSPSTWSNQMLLHCYGITFLRPTTLRLRHAFLNLCIPPSSTTSLGDNGMTQWPETSEVSFIHTSLQPQPPIQKPSTSTLPNTVASTDIEIVTFYRRNNQIVIYFPTFYFDGAETTTIDIGFQQSNIHLEPDQLTLLQRIIFPDQTYSGFTQSHHRFAPPHSWGTTPHGHQHTYSPPTPSSQPKMVLYHNVLVYNVILPENLQLSDLRWFVHFRTRNQGLLLHGSAIGGMIPLNTWYSSQTHSYSRLDGALSLYITIPQNMWGIFHRYKISFGSALVLWDGDDGLTRSIGYSTTGDWEDPTNSAFSLYSPPFQFKPIQTFNLTIQCLSPRINVIFTDIPVYRITANGIEFKHDHIQWPNNCQNDFTFSFNLPILAKLILDDADVSIGQDVPFQMFSVIGVVEPISSSSPFVPSTQYTITTWPHLLRPLAEAQYQLRNYAFTATQQQEQFSQNLIHTTFSFSVVMSTWDFGDGIVLHIDCPGEVDLVQAKIHLESLDDEEEDIIMFPDETNGISSSFAVAHCKNCKWSGLKHKSVISHEIRFALRHSLFYANLNGTPGELGHYGMTKPHQFTITIAHTRPLSNSNIIIVSWSHDLFSRGLASSLWYLHYSIPFFLDVGAKVSKRVLPCISHHQQQQQEQQELIDNYKITSLFPIMPSTPYGPSSSFADSAPIKFIEYWTEISPHIEVLVSKPISNLFGVDISEIEMSSTISRDVEQDEWVYGEDGLVQGHYGLSGSFNIEPLLQCNVDYYIAVQIKNPTTNDIHSNSVQYISIISPHAEMNWLHPHPVLSQGFQTNTAQIWISLGVFPLSFEFQQHAEIMPAICIKTYELTTVPFPNIKITWSRNMTYQDPLKPPIFEFIVVPTHYETAFPWDFIDPHHWVCFPPPVVAITQYDIENIYKDIKQGFIVEFNDIGIHEWAVYNFTTSMLIRHEGWYRPTNPDEEPTPHWGATEEHMFEFELNPGKPFNLYSPSQWKCVENDVFGPTCNFSLYQPYQTILPIGGGIPLNQLPSPSNGVLDTNAEFMIENCNYVQFHNDYIIPFNSQLHATMCSMSTTTRGVIVDKDPMNYPNLPPGSVNPQKGVCQCECLGLFQTDKDINIKHHIDNGIPIKQCTSCTLKCPTGMIPSADCITCQCYNGRDDLPHCGGQIEEKYLYSLIYIDVAILDMIIHPETHDMNTYNTEWHGFVLSQLNITNDDLITTTTTTKRKMFDFVHDKYLTNISSMQLNAYHSFLLDWQNVILYYVLKQERLILDDLIQTAAYNWEEYDITQHSYLEGLRLEPLISGNYLTLKLTWKIKPLYNIAQFVATNNYGLLFNIPTKDVIGELLIMYWTLYKYHISSYNNNIVTLHPSILNATLNDNFSKLIKISTNFSQTANIKVMCPSAQEWEWFQSNLTLWESNESLMTTTSKPIFDFSLLQPCPQPHDYVQYFKISSKNPVLPRDIFQLRSSLKNDEDTSSTAAADDNVDNDNASSQPSFQTRIIDEQLTRQHNPLWSECQYTRYPIYDKMLDHPQLQQQQLEQTNNNINNTSTIYPPTIVLPVRKIYPLCLDFFNVELAYTACDQTLLYNDFVNVTITNNNNQQDEPVLQNSLYYYNEELKQLMSPYTMKKIMTTLSENSIANNEPILYAHQLIKDWNSYILSNVPGFPFITQMICDDNNTYNKDDINNNKIDNIDTLKQQPKQQAIQNSNNEFGNLQEEVHGDDIVLVPPQALLQNNSLVVTTTTASSSLSTNNTSGIHAKWSYYGLDQPSLILRMRPGLDVIGTYTQEGEQQYQYLHSNTNNKIMQKTTTAKTTIQQTTPPDHYNTTLQFPWSVHIGSHSAAQLNAFNNIPSSYENYLLQLLYNEISIREAMTTATIINQSDHYYDKHNTAFFDVNSQQNINNTNEPFFSPQQLPPPVDDPTKLITYWQYNQHLGQPHPRNIKTTHNTNFINLYTNSMSFDIFIPSNATQKSMFVHNNTHQNDNGNNNNNNNNNNNDETVEQHLIASSLPFNLPMLCTNNFITCADPQTQWCNQGTGRCECKLGYTPAFSLPIKDDTTYVNLNMQRVSGNGLHCVSICHNGAEYNAITKTCICPILYDKFTNQQIYTTSRFCEVATKCHPDLFDILNDIENNSSITNQLNQYQPWQYQQVYSEPPYPYTIHNITLNQHNNTTNNETNVNDDDYDDYLINSTITYINVDIDGIIFNFTRILELQQNYTILPDILPTNECANGYLKFDYNTQTCHGDNSLLSTPDNCKCNGFWTHLELYNTTESNTSDDNDNEHEYNNNIHILLTSPLQTPSQPTIKPCSRCLLKPDPMNNTIYTQTYINPPELSHLQTMNSLYTILQPNNKFSTTTTLSQHDIERNSKYAFTSTYLQSNHLTLDEQLTELKIQPCYITGTEEITYYPGYCTRCICKVGYSGDFCQYQTAYARFWYTGQNIKNNFFEWDNINQLIFNYKFIEELTAAFPQDFPRYDNVFIVEHNIEQQYVLVGLRTGLDYFLRNAEYNDKQQQEHQGKQHHVNVGDYHMSKHKEDDILHSFNNLQQEQDNNNDNNINNETTITTIPDGLSYPPLTLWQLWVLLQLGFNSSTLANQDITTFLGGNLNWTYIQSIQNNSNSNTNNNNNNNGGGIHPPGGIYDPSCHEQGYPSWWCGDNQDNTQQPPPPPPPQVETPEEPVNNPTQPCGPNIPIIAGTSITITAVIIGMFVITYIMVRKCKRERRWCFVQRKRSDGHRGGVIKQTYTSRNISETEMPSTSYIPQQQRQQQSSSSGGIIQVQSATGNTTTTVNKSYTGFTTSGISTPATILTVQSAQIHYPNNNNNNNNNNDDNNNQRMNSHTHANNQVHLEVVDPTLHGSIWTAHTNANGRIFYFNHQTGKQQYRHPFEPDFHREDSDDREDSCNSF